MKAALGIGLPALPAAAKFVGNDAVMKAALGIGLPALPAAAKFVGNDAVMKAALGIGLGGVSGLLGDSHWSGPLAIGLYRRRHFRSWSKPGRPAIRKNSSS